MKRVVSVTPVTVTCDVCGLHLVVRCETTRIDGTEQARALQRSMETAHQAGWWVNGDGTAVCPLCRPTL